MKLKTYQAYTMAEALGAVRKDLGSSAVILNTRTFKRSGILGLRRKTIVEVTATMPQESAAPSKSRTKSTSSKHSLSPRQSARTAAVQRAYGEPTGMPCAQSATPEQITVEDDVNLTDQERTRRFAQQLLAEQFGERAGGSGEKASKIENEAVCEPSAATSKETPVEVEQASSARQEEIASELPPSSTATTHGRSRRFVLQPECGEGGEARRQEGTQVLSAQHAALRTDIAASTAAPQMQEELSAIRDMVGRVLQQQTRTNSGHPPTPTMPSQLFNMYLKLISQEISEELADRIVNDVRDELTTEQLHDEQFVKDAVMRHLADYIPTAMHAVPTESPDDRPLTIALIGPTGVGKTTTLAKLAATFKLRHQRRVGLVTADTYRIAAVEQLRTYANIIGLHVEVVLTPAEMRQAMHKLSDCDVVLIDTAGRSQNDVSRIEELKQIIHAAQPHEVHLVLSSAASEKVLIREAEAFSAVGMDKIVLTKLDEAVSFGMLVNVMRQLGKELSFVTTGQEVPDHIEPGRPERLAELVMGGSVHL